LSAADTAITEPDIVFVVAVADNGVIGHNNGLPWRLKSDLKRFKAITLNKPVVMGRKTFASIGKALPGRTNIVVTRDACFSAPDVLAVTSLPAARDAALGDALRRSVREIAVIGGAELFSQWMPMANRIEWTAVHDSPEGDTLFPPLDLKEWEEVARTRHSRASGDSADFSYVTYQRRVLR